MVLRFAARGSQTNSDQGGASRWNGAGQGATAGPDQEPSRQHWTMLKEVLAFVCDDLDNLVSDFFLTITSIVQNVNAKEN